jgi:hypothetical protein
MVDLSHDHVAEHEHTVGRGNHLVPPLHDGFVHLVGVAEGPTRVDDDVGVARWRSAVIQRSMFEPSFPYAEVVRSPSLAMSRANASFRPKL